MLVRFLVAMAAGLAAALCLPLLLPGPSRAGTAVELGIDGLVDASGLIVEARVLSAEVRQDAEGRIETEALLGVDRTLWGEDAAVRSVRLPGGVLPDGRGLLLPGMPVLRPGQRGLLFLTEESQRGQRVPVGLGQGVLLDALDASGNRVLTRDPAAPLRTVVPSGVDPIGAGRLDYAATIAEVHAAVAARRVREAAR
jgi:hypothetical protein